MTHWVMCCHYVNDTLRDVVIVKTMTHWVMCCHYVNDTLRDVVVLATFATSTQLGRRRRHRRRCPASDGVQRADQFHVEVGKAGQRHQVHHRVVENVTVDDLIDLIVSEDQRFAGARLKLLGVVAGGVNDALLSNHLQ